MAQKRAAAREVCRQVISSFSRKHTISQSTKVSGLYRSLPSKKLSRKRSKIVALSASKRPPSLLVYAGTTNIQAGSLRVKVFDLYSAGAVRDQDRPTSDRHMDLVDVVPETIEELKQLTCIKWKGRYRCDSMVRSNWIKETNHDVSGLVYPVCCF